MLRLKLALLLLATIATSLVSCQPLIIKQSAPAAAPYIDKAEKTGLIPLTAALPANSYALYFSKTTDPAPVLIALYSKATTALDIAVYSLTHPSIVAAILAAHKRGVAVRVITDKVQAAGNTQKHAINALLDAGVPVKWDTHSGLMHLKMSVIDNSIATTGSYNYTKAASEDNDEMLLVISELPYAARCAAEFARMWDDPVHYAPAVTQPATISPA